MPVKAIKSIEELWAELADQLYAREFISMHERSKPWLRPHIVHEFVLDGELRFEVIRPRDFYADAANAA